MKDDNCIFCKLANGDIPTYSLYEDDDFNVIFDAGPATVGHALIIPKEHAANIFELSEELTGRAFILAKKMAAVMTEVFGADGFNILQNNNAAAGQSVFHFHIHLIPRYENDHAIGMWTPGEQEKEKLESAIVKIREMMID
ncbi:MAG: HIT family protein [Parasporobacterium sp.]|nr:HIT family protein [Parasporobacterium sp.]